MPNTVVSLYADRSAAQAAADALERDGVARSRIHVHEATPSARNATSVQADELVTGGFASSFVDLLRGLLETPPAEGTATSYADLVRSEGTLMSVAVDDADDAQACASRLQQAGARRVSIFPEEHHLSWRRLFGG